MFDDFYGWIPWGQFLRLLDGYRMNLQIKGGFVPKNWDRVIITSNKKVEDWYNRFGEYDALLRRITKTVEVIDGSNHCEKCFLEECECEPPAPPVLRRSDATFNGLGNETP